MKYLSIFLVLFQVQALCAQMKNKLKDVKYKINNETTEIKFINNNTVRIFKYQGATAPVKNSLIVLNSKDKSINTTIRETDNLLIIQSSKLKVELNKDNGVVSFFDNNGLQLLAEKKEKRPFRKVDDSVTNVSQSFSIDPTEAIYGLGLHQNGKMNQRNQTILLKQRNMDIAIPFLQSTKGYGIYWDNYASTIYSSLDNSMGFTSEEGNCIDYYFIAAKNADAIIDGYRKLTGTAPMFPLWSFGYIQSRERYQSQEQIVDVVRKYRHLHVPIDAVVQDWQYWGAGDDNWNAVQFNNPKYPNPDAMIDSIHAMHAKILISVWPSFGDSTAIYKELDSKKMLFDFKTYPVSSNVRVYDAFNPKARDIYWNYMNRNLFAKGIDGWWLDATEPEQKKELGKQESDTFNTSVVKNVNTFLGSYRKYTNTFPFETVNGVYQNQRKTISNKRVFILTRSSFAGQQRAASMVWSGDVTSSWKTLKYQIPAALNYTLSGMPYWNSDIGGFISWTNYPRGNTDISYQELYIRWLQFGAFTGMMRSHGTNTPREIYQFGKPGDIAFDIIRKYIGLRYRLEPYIYSAAWAVTSKNTSLMRPLVMDYPQDKNVYDLGSEFLFGNSMLVKPITDSIFAKDAVRFDSTSSVSTKIYLPQGDWYNFDTNDKIIGGRWISNSFNLSQMPVFIKVGTILPLADEMQYSSIRNFQTLNINVYPGKNASFELYEDAGDNYNYEHGKYSIIKFDWNDSNRTLTIDNRKGSFNGMQKLRLFKINIIGTNSSKTIYYNGQRQLLMVVE